MHQPHGRFQLFEFVASVHADEAHEGRAQQGDVAQRLDSSQVKRAELGIAQIHKGWTTGFEPATAWTTTRSSTN